MVGRIPDCWLWPDNVVRHSGSNISKLARDRSTTQS